jgi:hypothetical protein
VRALPAAFPGRSTNVNESTPIERQRCSIGQHLCVSSLGDQEGVAGGPSSLPTAAGMTHCAQPTPLWSDTTVMPNPPAAQQVGDHRAADVHRWLPGRA